LHEIGNNLADSIALSLAISNRQDTIIGCLSQFVQQLENSAGRRILDLIRVYTWRSAKIYLHQRKSRCSLGADEGMRRP
jgi:hypothetical protein